MGMECEKNPPTLEHFDAWGRRIDHINTCHAWKQLHDISAEEGLIATAYHRKHKQWRYFNRTLKKAQFKFIKNSTLY